MDAQYLKNIAIPVGATIQVSLRGNDAASKRMQITGIVIACNGSHFTVQGPNYAESYLKVDLVSKFVTLTELKSEVTEQKGSDVVQVVSCPSEGVRGTLKKNRELALGAAK